MSGQMNVSRLEPFRPDSRLGRRVAAERNDFSIAADLGDRRDLVRRVRKRIVIVFRAGRLRERVVACVIIVDAADEQQAVAGRLRRAGSTSRL